MARPWTKRRIFKFTFKGRRARGLLWRKRVYEQWFEYARISPLSYPKEFGDLSTFKNFEEWWRHPNYGFELFCEPVEEPIAKVLGPVDFKDYDKNYLYLRVDLHSDMDTCMSRIKTIVRRKRKGFKPPKFNSNARFKPSVEMKRIHTETLERQRKAWVMKRDGFKRQEIVDELKIKQTYINRENALRIVSRDVERAKAIFEAISKGTFP